MAVHSADSLLSATLKFSALDFAALAPGFLHTGPPWFLYYVLDFFIIFYTFLLKRVYGIEQCYSFGWVTKEVNSLLICTGTKRNRWGVTIETACQNDQFQTPTRTLSKLRFMTYHWNGWAQQCDHDDVVLACRLVSLNACCVGLWRCLDPLSTAALLEVCPPLQMFWSEVVISCVVEGETAALTLKPTLCRWPLLNFLLLDWSDIYYQWKSNEKGILWYILWVQTFGEGLKPSNVDQRTMGW